MQKQIKLQEKEIEYTLKVSWRVKRMRLAIYRDGNFVVTVPRHVGQNVVERFMIEKSRWIIEKLEYFKNFPGPAFVPSAKKDYLAGRRRAWELVESRLAYFNSFYNFEFNRINIKNQKTRWGSCSKKGNLNFNYKIALLPEKLADYIIVHELCHLQEFNHSRNFWQLVAQTVPDYRELRRSLKTAGGR